ncbi:tetratricopeptide repeat protein [Candidatus Latescibacterota bacterium]
MLHFIAAQFPTPLLWGFDSWNYIPSYMTYILLAFGIISFFPQFLHFVKPLLIKAGNYTTRIPLFTAPIIAGIFFYIFRQKTFFLGDGQLRVRNTEIFYMFSFEEPLDTIIHTVLYKYLNPVMGLSGTDIYQYVSIFGGIAATGGMLYILRKLYEKRGERWFIGCLILTCGTVQFFFGYVESYTVAAVFLLLFLFSSLLMLKREQFAVSPIILYSCAVITHPLAILFFPGALYVYTSVIHGVENKSSKILKWMTVTGIFFCFIGLLLAFFRTGGHSPVQFITHYTGESNLLPLFSDGDLYGIFSAAHIVDIVNEIGLIVPASISFVVIAPGLFLMKRSRPALFLLMCCIGPLLFLGMFNPKLGYARDWDIFSMAAFPFTLLLGELIIENVKEDLLKIALPLVVISFIHMVSWIGVNSSESESLARFEFLSKTPYWTNHAKSMAHESIASNFYDRTDFRKSAVHYQKAYEFSGNKRFFMNVIASCRKTNDFGFLELFVEKYEKVPDGHYYMGLVYLEQNKYELAMKEFNKTLMLDPEYPEIHFQIGLTFVNMEKYDKGINEYKLALTKTQNKEVLSYIYNNFGNAYIKKDMIHEGIVQFLAAIKLKPDLSLAHYNLAYSYYALDQYKLSEKHVELALKYGYPAQELRKLINALSSKK